MSKIKLHGKDVIGIDEANNRFGINRMHGVRDFPFLVGGYLERNCSRSQNGNGKYERKGGVLSGRMPFEELLKRVRYYLDKHPDFYYVTVPRREMRGKSTDQIAVIRADVTTDIILSFFNNYNLSQERTVVVLDKMDGNEFTRHVLNLIRTYLKDSDLKVPLFARERADELIIPVKRADRILYFIAGLKLWGKRKRWPFRDRKIKRGHQGIGLESLASDDWEY